MRRAALALLVAALVAAALLRRRTAAYPSWEAWALDREGEATEPLFV